MARQSAQTAQRRKHTEALFSKEEKERRQLRAGPLGVWGESRKSADKANSLHSVAAAPHPRPGRPTLSHHSLSHKGHSTEDFPETNARVVGGAEARRNSWPYQVGVAPAQAFTQTRDAVHPPLPPKCILHVYVFLPAGSSLAV